jgi:hypothetical protein
MLKPRGFVDAGGRAHVDAAELETCREFLRYLSSTAVCRMPWLSATLALAVCRYKEGMEYEYGVLHTVETLYRVESFTA